MGRNNSDFELSHAKGDFTTHVFASHPETKNVVGMLQFEHFPPSGEIKHLYVRPETRRQGIASSLVEYGKKLADKDPEIPEPQHSNNRTESGNKFAEAMGAPKVSSVIRPSELSGSRILNKGDVVVSPDSDYNAPAIPEKLGSQFSLFKVERLSDG